MHTETKAGKAVVFWQSCDEFQVVAVGNCGQDFMRDPGDGHMADP
jgi:hypothetical protein